MSNTSNISNAVAAAIIKLGWEPGQIVYTKEGWSRLRDVLGLTASSYAWRTICANLVKHLEEDQVVERMELHRIKVITLRPLLGRFPTLEEGPKLHETSVEVLPEGTRLYVAMGHAVGLFLKKLVKPEQVITHGDYVSLEFCKEVSVQDIRDAGCTVYLERDEALRLIGRGYLKFSDLAD